MRRAILPLAALALILAACGAAAGPTALSDGAPGSIGAPLEGKRDAAAPQTAGEPARPDGSVPVSLAFNPDRALILTASIALRADDPWGTADRAQAIAIGLGGDVMSLSQSGSGESRSASLTLRVPADRFNDALKQLREMSAIEVVSSSVDGKDVTEQFVDLEARLTAKQAEEQRYLALLARAATVEDILRVEGALAAVRTRIEQLTGQLNSIRTRTEFSTIALSVTPLTSPITPPDGRVWDPARTAQQALAALAALVRVLGDALIWTVVFGWVPLLALLAALAVSRARSRVVTTP